MNAESIESYLHQNIPISEYMQISVSHCSADKIELSCPLAPNKNDKGIGFGGSLAAIAKLAGWAKFYEYVERNQLPGDLLIRSAETRFLKPCRGDILAVCESPPVDQWQTFESFLGKRGIGRIELRINVFSEQENVLEMTAQFAAVKNFKPSV